MIRAAVVLTVLRVAVNTYGAANGEITACCGGASRVLLGSVRARGLHDAGWGMCAPRFFTNGGDATGQVVQIRWTNLGQGNRYGTRSNGAKRTERRRASLDLPDLPPSV
jgi:hypothetical protein